VTHLYHTSGLGRPFGRRVRSESMGPIRHVRPFGRPCIAPLAMGNHRAHHHSTFAPEESSWKMHQEHAADSDMVEAN